MEINPEQPPTDEEYSKCLQSGSLQIFSTLPNDGAKNWLLDYSFESLYLYMMFSKQTSV